MEASLFPTRPVIIWFRDDLRLVDNPALSAAAASGRPLLSVFVHDEEIEGLRPLGGAALWWLHGALEALSDGLAARGGRLFFFRGPAADLIERLAVDSTTAAIYWNRRYDDAGRLSTNSSRRLSGSAVSWSRASTGTCCTSRGRWQSKAARRSGSSRPFGAPPVVSVRRLDRFPHLKPYPVAHFRKVLGRASSRLPILRSSPSPPSGTVACAQHGSAVSRAHRHVSNGSLPAACPAMRPIETDRTSRPPHGSLPIFASATSPSARSGMPLRRRWCHGLRAPASKTLRSSCRNSAGASSPIICSTIIRISRVAIFEHDSTPRPGGGIP